MRCIRLTIALLGLLAALPLRAEPSEPFSSAPYVDARAVDLTHLLPPPPAPDSAETRIELGELLVVQVNRSPDMIARAQADAVEEVWRFADVVGPKFTPENLPHTAALFARLVATDTAVTDPAKAFFARKRPFQVSDLIRPVLRPSASGSWPSSHAALGTLMSIVLGELLPSRRAAIAERASAYAENRVIAGMHFPSDVEMGRIAGTVIAAEVMKQPAFLADLEAARVEMRAVLGP